MTLDDTLIGLVVRNAERWPDDVALREKRFGIWRPTTWAEFRDAVTMFARGLRALGFRPGDTLAILGDNKPEWIVAEFGAIAAGGVATGIYADCLPEEIQHLLTVSDARLLVVRDQEQVDKILKIWERVEKRVLRVVVWDSRGMSHYYDDHPFLARFEDVARAGAVTDADGPAFLRAVAESLDPGRPALMLTTSGTTAAPKLSVLSHANLLVAARAYGEVVPVERSDELLALAPLPWIGEQLYNLVRFLLAGARYNFPEETETVRRDLLELQPSYFGGTPASWELLISSVQAAMDNADVVKRGCYRWAVEVARRRTAAALAGRRARLTDRLLLPLLEFFVLRPLKNRMGLGRVRMAVTGGGAMAPEVFTFFKALGLDLRQVYGQTECCGIATTHRGDDVRPETVGLAIPGVEVKLSAEGEILIRGKNTHLGYFGNEQATRESYTDDGFLRTGDAGYFGEDGHLYVFDRFKDMMVLDDGTRFAPQDLETRLKFSPYIKEVMVCGARRPFVVAIVSIDLENVGNWAKKRGLAFTTLQDLSQKREVYELIGQEIRTLCARFPENIRVRRFAVLLKELHPDDGELTRTRKVRRALVTERYGALIEDLYGARAEHALDVRIRYEDGREASFAGSLRLAEVAR